jgi:hypothetical protein
MIDRQHEIKFSVEGPMQSHTQIGYSSGEFLWDDVLFEPDELYFFTRFQPKGGLSLRLFASTGSQVDFANSRLADQVLLEPSVDWNMNRFLLLNLQASLLTLDTKEGEKIIDAGVYDLRLIWQFSRRSFLRLTAQYTAIERNVDQYVYDVDANTHYMGRQLLYSYKINPQTVFFLGYSDNYLENDDLVKLEITDRTWFMKIGYAWMP